MSLAEIIFDLFREQHYQMQSFHVDFVGNDAYIRIAGQDMVLDYVVEDGQYLFPKRLVDEYSE